MPGGKVAFATQADQVFSPYQLIEAAAAEVSASIDALILAAGLADKIEGAVLPIDKPGMFAFTRREPLGVVAGTAALWVTLAVTG